MRESENNLKQKVVNFGSAAIVAGASFLSLPQNTKALPLIELAPHKQEQLIPLGYHPTQDTWMGKATYYSKAGCDQCSEGQIMSNGKPFNENAHTIAFMRAPLGSIVLITNMDNGLSCVAEVTDHGGFEEYGLIADLSLAVKEKIKGISGMNIKITVLEKNQFRTYRLIYAD